MLSATSLPQLPLRLVLALRDRAAGDDRERGDVPGWVLITVMTATIVSVLWAFVGPQLQTMIEQAINGVVAP